MSYVLRTLALTLFAGAMLSACGSSSKTVEDRCNDWCARHNAEDDCGADFNCAPTCSAFQVNSQKCPSQTDALLDCFEAKPDGQICESNGTQACSAENTALTMCQNMP
jgi:hypothetical protein